MFTLPKISFFRLSWGIIGLLNCLTVVLLMPHVVNGDVIGAFLLIINTFFAALGAYFAIKGPK